MRYGPYSLGMVPEPNDLVEVSVTEEIRAILYRYYKARASEATGKLYESQNEKILSEYDQKQLEAIVGKENIIERASHKQLVHDSPSDDEDGDEISPSEKKTGFGESLLSSKR